jgi:hypothetical protein
MKKLLTTVSSILYLVTIVNCNKPHVTNIPSKSIQTGTVIIEPTNGISSSAELIIDGNRIHTEYKKDKKTYSRLEISGLATGMHHFLIISAHEVFGLDQFELELNDKHGEYKSIFSKQINYTLPPKTFKGTSIISNNNNNKIKAKLI